VTLEDAYILIHEEDLLDPRFSPHPEAIAKTGQPLLFVSEDLEGDALATLMVNKLRGTLAGCAVKAPGFG
jgi:chaperonin GroEL